MNKGLTQNTGRLLKKIQKIIEEARNKVYHTANTEMLRAYWNIGMAIVEEEQKGKGRADYGSALLEELATRRTDLYGKSFSSRNLRYMRQFYREFPKWNAVRSELYFMGREALYFHGRFHPSCTSCYPGQEQDHYPRRPSECPIQV